jgi:hypothetical protein
MDGTLPEIDFLANWFPADGINIDQVKSGVLVLNEKSGK